MPLIAPPSLRRSFLPATIVTIRLFYSSTHQASSARSTEATAGQMLRASRATWPKKTLASHFRVTCLDAKENVIGKAGLSGRNVRTNTRIIGKHFYRFINVLWCTAESYFLLCLARAPDVTSCKSRCKMYERYMCNWSIEVIYVAIAYLLTA